MSQFKKEVVSYVINSKMKLPLADYVVHGLLRNAYHFNCVTSRTAIKYYILIFSSWQVQFANLMPLW